MTVHVRRIGGSSTAAQRRVIPDAAFERRHSTAAMATAAAARIGALINDQARADILVDGITDTLVFSLEMVDTVLLVGKPPAALAAHEGVLLAALVLEVAVEVVVPVVGPLQINLVF